MDTYQEMYQKAIKDEGPEGLGCIAWILAILVVPALAGWGVSELLAESKFATVAGIVTGLVLFVLAIVGSIWYANRRGWLNVLDEEDY